MSRTAATEILEVIAGKRCPCGHLGHRHHIPSPEESHRFGPLLIEVFGECRDCDCKGLIEGEDA